MNRTAVQLRAICKDIIEKKVHRHALEFTLEDFQDFYNILLEKLENHAPKTSIVNLGNEVFVQFSSLSPQHFLVIHKFPLSENEFAFLPNKIWHGSTENIPTFRKFFVGELRINRVLLFLTFGVSFILMFVTRDDGLYDVLSNLVLQASTVFLSIYLIFTVTQNTLLATDKKLFDSGKLQKYYYDDRFLSLLAILTIVFTFLNLLLTHLLITLKPNWPIGSIVVDRHLFLSFSSALLISMLFHTFVTVANYYLKRSRDVIERNLVSEILHEDFEKNFED